MQDYIGDIKKRVEWIQRLLSNEESYEKKMTLYTNLGSDTTTIKNIFGDVDLYNIGIRTHWGEIKAFLESWLKKYGCDECEIPNAQPDIYIRKEINLEVSPIPHDFMTNPEQVNKVMMNLRELSLTQSVHFEHLKKIENEYLEYVNPPKDQNPYGGGGKQKRETESPRENDKRARHSGGEFENPGDFGDFDEFINILSGEFEEPGAGAGAPPGARVSLPSVWHVV